LLLIKGKNACLYFRHCCRFLYNLIFWDLKSCFWHQAFRINADDLMEL